MAPHHHLIHLFARCHNRNPLADDERMTKHVNFTRLHRTNTSKLVSNEVAGSTQRQYQWCERMLLARRKVTVPFGLVFLFTRGDVVGRMRMSP